MAESTYLPSLPAATPIDHPSRLYRPDAPGLPYDVRSLAWHAKHFAPFARQLFYNRDVGMVAEPAVTVSTIQFVPFSELIGEFDSGEYSLARKTALIDEDIRDERYDRMCSIDGSLSRRSPMWLRSLFIDRCFDHGCVASQYGFQWGGPRAVVPRTDLPTLFAWDETPEGHEFWHIHIQILAGMPVSFKVQE